MNIEYANNLDHTPKMILSRNWPHRSPYIIGEVVKDIIRDKVVCDIGCAEGDQMSLFSLYAKEVVGVELNESRARVAIEHGFNVKLGNYKEIGIPDADVYFCWIDPEEDALFLEFMHRRNKKATCLLFCRKGNHVSGLVDKWGGRLIEFDYKESAVDLNYAKCGKAWVGVIEFPTSISVLKKVVLTVDDRLIYNYTNVAPILDQYGFKCTFFVTAKPDVWKGLRGFDDMNWEQCVDLHKRGFEIANHTYGHFPITHGIQQFKNEIILLDQFFADLGIDKPVSFAYPGYLFDEDLNKEGQAILSSLGFKYARLGYPVDQWHYDVSKREYTYYFNPRHDNKLNLRITGVLNKDYTIEHFKSDIENMPDGCVGIFSTHYVESPYEIDRLHKICQFIKESKDVNMSMLRDV